MSERASTDPQFEPSIERFGRGVVTRLQFASFRESGATIEFTAQIAAWANEGGAGGEVRR